MNAVSGAADGDEGDDDIGEFIPLNPDVRRDSVKGTLFSDEVLGAGAGVVSGAGAGGPGVVSGASGSTGAGTGGASGGAGLAAAGGGGALGAMAHAPTRQLREGATPPGRRLSRQP